MDLRNFGASDLSIRIYLENPMGAPPTDEAVTSPFLLPAEGGWTHTPSSPSTRSRLQNSLAMWTRFLRT